MGAVARAGLCDMADGTAGKNGLYSTDFISVPAGEVRVAGLPAGAAGSFGVLGRWCSSLAGVFTVSPETVKVLPPAVVSIALRPASFGAPAAPARESRHDYEDVYGAREGALLTTGD
jgi:hypothetical protein